MSQVQWQNPVVHKPSIQLAKISASEYRAKLEQELLKMELLVGFSMLPLNNLLSNSVFQQIGMQQVILS